MQGALAIPEEVCSLLADIDTFISQTLKGENLSKKAKEKREVLLKKIKEVKASYPQEFQDKELEDEEESESSFSSPPDSVSIASDRYDKEDEAPSDGNQFPPVAAQDLQFVLKAGYLEKRRKDHSFLGFEWQKRWCAISKTIFYYYGSDKDKQQKGEFALEGYTIRMNNSLRKDAKKDCCFEISAPDKRIYQFTAATPKEAEEWVQQVKFVIQDMESNTIPEEEEEEYDDVGQVSSEPIDDSIYEEVKALEDQIFSLTRGFGDIIFKVLQYCLLWFPICVEDIPKPAVLTTACHLDPFYYLNSVCVLATTHLHNRRKEVLSSEERVPSKAEVSRKLSQEKVTTVSDSKNTDYANFYQGLWDCTGDVPDELTFKRGDVIYILSKEYNRFGWWVGEMKGTIGLVPKAYIMEMYDI
ncbi:src kinase-associated phosphoprotein 2 isoform X1 [Rissa tridactyla]|uniref:src kinase-associated phosphoprotein 2 isoform X1 n=1 Tax=Rissa tridactyla TaxID=75485 RepID=UPI0023BADE69|nr:src kinase-associated phosphoprotein 2 isoform X1 [Rissa tridactyla]